MTKDYDIESLLIRTQSLDPKQRRIGKTYMAAELAKKVGGVLVTFNAEEARRVSKDLQVDCVPLHSGAHGVDRPLIIDQDALVRHCLDP